MSNGLIGYVFFDSNEDFQTWQLDNGGVEICAISPCPKAVEMQDNNKRQLDLDAQVQMQVFVTYREPEINTL